MLAFGRFCLDSRRRVLLVDGVPVDLQSRPLEILEFLIDTRDRVVSREEIVAHVWRGAAMADNNLTVQMSALRRVLGDHGGGNLIITLPGRGYRFVADIEPPPCAPSGAAAAAPLSIASSPPEPAGSHATPAPPRRTANRTLRALAGVFAALALLLLTGLAARYTYIYVNASTAPPLSIAVLPFRNLSEDRTQDYMADAISDDLTTDLSHIPGSIVIARESSDSYRGRAVPTAEIGHALNVRYLLEGSLRREDSVYSINAQLIEAASGAHLWAERFQTPLTQLAETRNTIVRRIASALDTTLTDIEGGILPGGNEPAADALKLFMHARDITLHDDSPATLIQAQALLEQALQQRPAFPEALAQLGTVLLAKIGGSDDPDNTRDEARAHTVLSQALRIAPRSVPVLAAEARLHEADGNCVAASLSANAAIAIEPSDIEALGVLARCALNEGDIAATADKIMTILRLNPEGRTNKGRYMVLSEMRLLQGRYEEAIGFANQSLDGDPDPTPEQDMTRPDFCRLLLIAGHQLSGDAQRAHDRYLDYSRVWPNHTVWRIAAYAPPAIAALHGYVDFMQALHLAGMPMYADEEEDAHVTPSTTPHEGRDFDPTPLEIPGAKRINTAALQDLITQRPPLIIDVGRGKALIEGAIWNDHSGADADDNVFLDRVLSQQPHIDRETTIVVMATGTAGFDSYNASLHIAALGYHNVLWYRGGEEAWAKAGLRAHRGKAE